MPKEVARQERNWCICYSALLMLLTSVPYLIAFTSQGSEWRFTGFVFGVADGNSYIAKMLLGSTGALLFRTPYTSVPQQGVLAFLPYILLGKLGGGSGLHEQLVALYHLLRIAAIPLVVWATYRFVAFFVDQVPWRRWATVMATVGGGLGWIPIILGESGLLGSQPLEFFSPETFGFLSLYGIPHLTLARALLLLGMRAYLDSGEQEKQGWVAGGLFALLTLVQPLAVATGVAVIAAHLVGAYAWGSLRKEPLSILPWLKGAARAILVASPFIAYFICSYITDPFLQAWSSQNKLASPHPVLYLLAFGLLLWPGLVGGRALLRSGRVQDLLPVVWVLSLPILAYAPVTVQRRLPEGTWPALCTLAALGLMKAFPASRPARSLRLGILALSLPASIFLVAGGIQVALSPALPVFRPATEVRAFEWLGEQVGGGDVVLASFETGNALPAWVPSRVVAGHGPESANLEEILPNIESFYAGRMSEAERRAFLREQAVSYVFWGPEEEKLGEASRIIGSALPLHYEREGYRVYQAQSE